MLVHIFVISPIIFVLLPPTLWQRSAVQDLGVCFVLWGCAPVCFILPLPCPRFSPGARIAGHKGPLNIFPLKSGGKIRATLSVGGLITKKWQKK